jgi:putative ABC transport system substrate-binding protein
MTLLGSAAAIWPHVVLAQSTDRVRRIGVLLADGESPVTRTRLTVFKQALDGFGWSEGRNVSIDYRFHGGNVERMRSLAKELVGAQSDVIFTATTRPTAVLRQETSTIPIVFAAVSDPIGDGLVESFARPGGNVTGFTDIEASMAGKWPELLKEIAPNLVRLALIFNPDTAPGKGSLFLRPFETTAPAFGLEPISAPVRNAGEIEAAVAALAGQPGGGLVIMPDVSNAIHRGLIIGLAARHHLPAVYPYKHFVTGGGLMSYGADNIEQWRQAASYLDRILRGVRPADLPVQQPTKFELVINLKTAKALSLTVPPLMVARADEVIE